MSDKLSIKFESLTWQECARLVQATTARNRALSERRIEMLARVMKSGRFLETHQGIALDDHGNVIDGQHRLMAARSRTDLCILVARYSDAQLAAEAMAVFDSGRARSMADGLAIGGIMPQDDAGQMTSVCNMMAGLLLFSEKTPPVRDLQETGEFFRAHRESVQWAVSHAPRGGAPVRAAFAFAWEPFPERTAELAAQIKGGVALPGTASALWNRATNEGLLTPAGPHASRRDVAYRALRILRAQAEGVPAPAKLYASEDSLKWFMTQRRQTIGSPASVEAAESLRIRVVAAVPAGGARFKDIVRTVGGPANRVAVRLRRLVTDGTLLNPERGVYLPAKVSA